MVFDALGLLGRSSQFKSQHEANDVQDAYAVTIYDYMPIAEASNRFPLFQGQLQTVGRNNYKSLIQAQRQDFAATWRYGQIGETQSRSFGNLYTEIRYTFIRDMRVNTTGKQMLVRRSGNDLVLQGSFSGSGNIRGNEKWSAIHAPCNGGGLPDLP